jgi:hydroxymethylglutaryl-CoA reductase
MDNKINKSIYDFAGFSKLNYVDRLNKLKDHFVMTEEDISFFKNGGLHSPDLGEKFVENLIGYFQIPMGVATNFCIDGVDYIIPMAVEETSIIAAASKTAKWVRENGKIETEVIDLI